MEGRVRPKKYYRTLSGAEPAREYLANLDKPHRVRVFMQIDKLKSGNTGHGHGVGGVSELVVDVGPGYRVYYAIVDGNTLILLLTAGDKATQKEDIKMARSYLTDYEKRMKKASRL